MRKILMGLGAISLLLSPAYSANAADLGGDCCADLEERVAELEATTVKKRTRGLSMTISGRVNSAFMNYSVSLDATGTGTRTTLDNSGNPVTREYSRTVSGDRSNFIHGPGAASKISIDGRGQINSDLEAGYRFSFEWDGLNGSEIGINDGGTTDAIAAGEAYFFIRSATVGAISVGTRGQSYGSAAKVDVTGSLGEVANIDPKTYFGSDLSAILNHTDGDAGSGDLAGIRYDSPTIGGLILTADWVNKDENTDVFGGRLTYANQWGDLKIAAAAGIFQYSDVSEDGDTIAEKSGVLGSVGLMHTPTGLFLNVGGGQTDQDDGNDETWHYSVTGGVQFSALSVGKTTIYGQYYDSEQGAFSIDDVEFINTESGGINSYDISGFSSVSYYGVGIVQSLDAVGMRLYAGYRHYDIDYSDVTGTFTATNTYLGEFEGDAEVDVFLAGAIINF